MVNSTSLFTRPNITNFTNLFTYVQYVTNDMFMNLGLALFWIVSFVAMAGYTNTKNAFATSSFITAVLSMLFWTVGVVSEFVVLVMVIATAASAFYLFKD